MLDISKATQIVRSTFPEGRIELHIEYENLFVFQVFLELPGEEGFDPFYSVNRDTGEIRDFSVLTDGDTNEIFRLFTEEMKRR